MHIHDTASLRERFWAKVDKNGPIVRPELGPCWLWTAGLNGSGYGQITVKINEGIWRPLAAHRVSYALAYGDPPPDQPWTLHHCDVRRCVRPDHLFAGVRLDNIADAVSKQRHSHGRGRPAAKLSEDQVRAIRAIPDGAMSQPEIAEIYSVSRSVIEHIRLGKAWKHVQ